MKKRVKLMLAALLGFSTACSTVKNAPQESPEGLTTLEASEAQRIKLMYGVPSPRPTLVEEKLKTDTTEVDKGKKIYAEPLESPVENAPKK
ncbi:MAG: hypothetical protein J6B59_00295 [Alistipes sp.]|nr:hypothetical protein [Rikenellaceae bacterium]MBO5187715.1 hypothetical protein [Alistipes sp.]MBQ2727724.1 hypothetical protein [Alistipes sp.]MBQ3082647.1 hypothetical protein [Alistipes sp.]MBQ8470402.1 hypothetical protein [Alistipes sp.]